MSREGSSRRVLEVGPGEFPLHNRSQDEALKLADNESYVGVDIEKKNLQGDFWEEMQKKYGERVMRMVGDGSRFPLRDRTQDEIVMLSSNTRFKDLKEVERVIKFGGLVRFGMNKALANHFLNREGRKMEQMGFVFKEFIEYDYNKVQEIEGYQKFPYAVLTFEKIDNGEQSEIVDKLRKKIESILSQYSDKVSFEVFVQNKRIVLRGFEGLKTIAGSEKISRMHLEIDQAVSQAEMELNLIN